jgi:hypothetical protein
VDISEAQNLGAQGVSRLNKPSRKQHRNPTHHKICKTEQPELKLCLNAAWTSAIAVAATNPQRRSALLDRAPQVSIPVTICCTVHQIKVAPVQNATGERWRMAIA